MLGYLSRLEYSSNKSINSKLNIIYHSRGLLFQLGQEKVFIFMKVFVYFFLILCVLYLIILSYLLNFLFHDRDSLKIAFSHYIVGNYNLFR